MRRVSAVGLLLVSLAAAPSAGARPRPAITPDGLAAHVRELSDDRYAGREATSPGGKAAAAYVATRFRAAGLVPVGGAGFLHPVQLVQVRVAAAAVQAGPTVVGAGVLARPASDMPALGANGPLWRASAAAPARPPPAGVVVALRLPTAPDAAIAALEAAMGAARMAGAVALVAVTAGPPGDPVWARLEASWARPAMLLPGRPRLPVAALSAPAARTLFAPGELDGAPGPLGRDGGIILAQAVEPLMSSNVIGRLPGRGARAAEHLLVTAHWDHLGRCDPTGPDPICKGAVDNASGVAGLIELARALVRGPRPARSILFIATTAEEHGLLGARAFLARPPVPRDSLVAGLNFDTIAAAGPPGPVTVLGEGLTTLDPLIARAARGAGRTVISNPSVQSFFRRSDNWAFVEAGIPVLALTSVFPAPGHESPSFADYMANRYHQPGDEWSAALDLSGAAADVELARRVLRLAANARTAPGWRPGRAPGRSEGAAPATRP